MKQQIEYLRRLQTLDSRVFGLEKELEEIPRKFLEFERALAGCLRKMDEVKAKLTSMQKEIDRKDVELSEKEEKAARLVMQQNTAQSNEEYSAFQREIENERRHASQLEDEMLELMTELDKLRLEKERLGKEVEREESRLNEERKKLQARQVELEREIACLKSERSSSAEKVQIDLLILYDKILAAKRDRRALAAVRDSICGGCSMTLTLQEVAQVKVCKDVVICKHCGRILYEE